MFFRGGKQRNRELYEFGWQECPVEWRAHRREQLVEAAALAEFHLNIEVAILLPSPVLAHEVGMGGQGCHRCDLMQAALAVRAAGETMPGALDCEVLARDLMPCPIYLLTQER